METEAAKLDNDVEYLQNVIVLAYVGLKAKHRIIKRLEESNSFLEGKVKWCETRIRWVKDEVRQLKVKEAALQERIAALKIDLAKAA